ncbi:MAG: class E sortase [Acidimicrobiales bacterium]
MDVRTVIRGIGKTLISVGVLLFLFVGYQLWGTGLAEAKGQRALEDSFQRRLTPLPALPGDSPTSSPTTRPPIQLGDATALIEIPKIDVKKFVVEGVGVEDLKQGPGHYPETPMPGQKGNAAIAGHRTTYGAPFWSLDELAGGDQIFVTTSSGRFQYDVTELLEVDPSAVHVLDPTGDDRLTLTTCHPRFSASERLIVVAKLMSAPSDTPPPEVVEPVERTSAPRSLDAGLSGEGTSKTPAILWGLVAGSIWAGAFVLGRFWRRWPAYAIALVPFLLALFVFYENVARLLPANV